jgi:hypothetical protein
LKYESLSLTIVNYDRKMLITLAPLQKMAQ